MEGEGTKGIQETAASLLDTFQDRKAKKEKPTITTLNDVAFILRTAQRHGAEHDFPEGVRWVRISDTLAHEMAAAIEQEMSDAPHKETTASGGCGSAEEAGREGGTDL